MNIEEPDMAASLRKHAGSLGHIHFADSNREAPGHGHTDFRSVLLTLQESGYKGFFSFEVLPRPSERQALEDAVSSCHMFLESS
jgi:sugar phosphate isomerase/epimerase